MHKPVILVTGASKGIGLAVTKHLLYIFSANVVAISRTVTPELEALKSDSLLTVTGDVTDEHAWPLIIQRTLQKYNAIDGLILNAGTLDPLCRIGDDTPLDSWKKHFDVNFFSLVTALKATLPVLRKSELGGRVVFVSSGAAVKGTAGWGPYNASKAAMNSLSRTLAEEEPDIKSVAVRPGMVDTGMQHILRESGGIHMAEEAHKMFVRTHAEGKLVKPEDCGHVIAALAIKAPKSLNGQFVSWDSEECKDFRKD
ncbi:short-chain dehydrogenase [Crucibulum laeve]|uniref:Short-chain dehydrogenase n=1 Tax=Crucibulum laeve TaxID=68775 RepID=A0A5C3MFP8_9AGAR|nr:short-chain dehydrogenase [Crucibulum laeve]